MRHRSVPPPRDSDSTYRRDRDDGGESGRGGTGRGRNNDRRGRGGRGSIRAKVQLVPTSSRICPAIVESLTHTALIVNV